MDGQPEEEPTMNGWKRFRGANACAGRLIALALALGAAGVTAAQGPAPAAQSASTPAKQATLDILVGSWVRPDGGYVIAIKSVGSGGDLQAMYFNPTPLPFAQAQATREGGVLRVQFELRAGGYNGSTYRLRYDPASDRLVGIYYQAVAQQSFEVQFVRK
jgi:uncharacterized protein (DUF2147 family)